MRGIFAFKRIKIANFNYLNFDANIKYKRFVFFY